MFVGHRPAEGDGGHDDSCAPQRNRPEEARANHSQHQVHRERVCHQFDSVFHVLLYLQPVAL